MPFRKYMKPGKFANARHMIRNPTPTERILWDLLKNRALMGKRFRRQAPMLGYIADFYCPESSLVVELDGAHHNDQTQKSFDDERDARLLARGIKTIRFSNGDVYRNIGAVLFSIGKAL